MASVLSRRLFFGLLIYLSRYAMKFVMCFTSLDILSLTACMPKVIKCRSRFLVSERICIIDFQNDIVWINYEGIIKSYPC